jgi:hypothetical protein
MAIEKVINIKVSGKDAENNLKEINKTLEEQREILILLEKELLDVQDAQSKTSKTNLAAQKQLTTQSNHLKSAIKDQRLGLKSLNIERRGAVDSLADLNKGSKDNGNIIKSVDKLTGGYASKIIKLKKGFFSSIKVIKGFVTGLSGVKKALISTGIGALVVALGTIVAYWDDIKGFVSGVSSEQKKLNAESEANVKAQQNSLDAISSQEKSLRLSGKSEEEIRQLKIAQTEEVIKASVIQLEQMKATKKAQVEAAQRNKDIAQGVIRFLTVPITVLLGTVDQLTKAISKIPGIDIETNLEEGFSGGLANMLFDPKEVASESDAVIKEAEKSLIALQNKKDGFILQSQKADQLADEKAKQKKLDEEQKLNEALERIRKGEIDTEAERRSEELFQVQEQYRKLIEEADKYNQSTTELIEAQNVKEQELKDKFAQQDKDRKDKEEKEAAEKKLQEQEKLIGELELKKENQELNFDEQRQLITEREQLLIQDKTLTEEQKLKLESQFSDAKINLAKQESEAKQESLDGYASALGSISGLLGQQTAEGKAIAIASSLVNTYAAISGQLKAFSGVAVPGFAIAQAIATGLVGLANVKKIASVKIPNSGGGGGGGVATSGSIPRGGASTPTPPSFNLVGASETSALSDAVASSTNEPVQAFVVANDVTTAQSLQNNIVEGSTI